MNHPILAMLTAAAVLAGVASPAAIRAFAAEPSPGLQLAADESFKQKREDYEAKARQQMDLWGQRIKELGTKAKEKGSELSKSAEQQLDAAWAETKERWQKLKDASAATWDQTRAAYERAKAKLDESWRKAQDKSE